MERILPQDKASVIASLCIQILTVPIPSDFQPDAIVGHAGMGEPWRITGPIKYWTDSTKLGCYLLLAGMYWEEKYYEPLSIEHLVERYGLRRTACVRVQEKARHTRAQTDWIIEQTNELSIASLIFLTSLYHLPRAYLTLLKSYLRFSDHKMVMLPKPLAIPPAIILPEVGKPAREMIAGEVQRIFKYQQPKSETEDGDVATLAELENYLDTVAYPALGLSP